MKKPDKEIEIVGEMMFVCHTHFCLLYYFLSSSLSLQLFSDFFLPLFLLQFFLLFLIAVQIEEGLLSKTVGKIGAKIKVEKNQKKAGEIGRKKGSYREKKICVAHKHLLSSYLYFFVWLFHILSLSIQLNGNIKISLYPTNKSLTYLPIIPSRIRTLSGSLLDASLYAFDALGNSVGP